LRLLLFPWVTDPTQQGPYRIHLPIILPLAVVLLSKEVPLPKRRLHRLAATYAIAAAASPPRELRGWWRLVAKMAHRPLNWCRGALVKGLAGAPLRTCPGAGPPLNFITQSADRQSILQPRLSVSVNPSHPFSLSVAIHSFTFTHSSTASVLPARGETPPGTRTTFASLRLGIVLRTALLPISSGLCFLCSRRALRGQDHLLSRRPPPPLVWFHAAVLHCNIHFSTT
jgi:hypothetical protein